MQSLRRLSYTALTLAFTQIVFGAIVRITGSGMGCGDHWPKCAGQWFPPANRIDLIIEITHRYIALGLSVVVIGLCLTALTRRREPGVGGEGGVLRPATLATALVVTAALLGAITVKMALNPLVIAAHLTIAMSLLATLAIAAGRAGGFAAEAELSSATTKTWRAARVAVGLALITIVFGALTANLPDAAASCGGFPLCRTIVTHGSPLYVQVVHRILAFLLFGHLMGIAIGTSRRKEPAIITRSARVALGAAILQILVAAAMIEMHFPPVFRSLHQAFGTLVWLSIVVLAIITKRVTNRRPMESEMRAAA
ncbi:MAG: COX15/CtaA family protein [Gemmatimonadaceae bacterium]